MHLPDRIRRMLLRYAKRVMDHRPPDMVVGAPDNPYLHRWRIFPRNDIANVYVHKFHRDDDDRALHDHPYDNVSVVLENGYYEHLSHMWEPPLRSWRGEGWIGTRPAIKPHRVVVVPDKLPISLFFHGPRTRKWGFWCPNGWRPWQVFHGQNNPANPNNSGGHQSGKGCE